VGAPLAILAAFAVALALAGPGGGNAARAGGDRLDPNVALRISARDPARTLPRLAPALATAASQPALSRALHRGSAALTRAGVDPKREVLAPLSFVVISLERSCPPPAILACRPAIRFVGRLRDQPPLGLQRDLRAALVAGLRAAGFQRMVVRGSQASGELAGRVSSRGEALARWRLMDGVLEVVTGGLALQPPAAAAAVLRSASAEARAGSSPTAALEVNPTLLATLVGDGSP
jgi:hypothetical protein